MSKKRKAEKYASKEEGPHQDVHQTIANECFTFPSIDTTNLSPTLKEATPFGVPVKIRSPDWRGTS